MAINIAQGSTLRAHKSAITCFKFISISVIPLLLSGDSNGDLYLWNLLTRRPILHYSLNQGDGGNYGIVSLDHINGIYVIHSKDHNVRFFRTLGNDTIIERCDSREPFQTFVQIYEIPVNSLNFANVSVTHLKGDLYQLSCTNTMNSEGIDIYNFDINDPHSLKRIFADINFYETVKAILNDKEVFRFEKLGIVMKFLECNATIFFGFESGFVIGVRMQKDLTILSKDGEAFSPKSGLSKLKLDVSKDIKECLEIVYISSLHYPNPVLALSYGHDAHTLISSSTDDKIGIHHVPKTEEKSQIDVSDYHTNIERTIIVKRSMEISTEGIETSVKEVGYVSCAGDSMALGTWSGKTVIFKSLRPIQNFSRSKSNVLIDPSAVGSFQNPDKEKKRAKIGAMCLLPKNKTPGGGYKSKGEERRAKKFFSEDWCIIGYEDGSIALHSIISKP